MLQMLRDLVAHKGHANAALLHAIRQNGRQHPIPSCGTAPPRLARQSLLAAHRSGGAVRSRRRGSPLPLVQRTHQRYGSTQAQEAAWLETATEGNLGGFWRTLAFRTAGVPSRKRSCRYVCTRTAIGLSVRSCFGDTAACHHRRTTSVADESPRGGVVRGLWQKSGCRERGTGTAVMSFRPSKVQRPQSSG